MVSESGGGCGTSAQQLITFHAYIDLFKLIRPRDLPKISQATETGEEKGEMDGWSWSFSVTDPSSPIFRWRGSHSPGLDQMFDSIQTGYYS